MAVTYFISTADFQTQTGITITESSIDQALTYAYRQILHKFFKKHTLKIASASSDGVYFLNTPLADGDGDTSAIDVGDLNIFELDSDYTETDLSGQVTSVKGKYGRIVVNTSYPSSGSTMYVEYYTAKYDQENMADVLARIATMYAVNWLFTNVPFERLQAGISSWTLNGTNVTFDRQAMSETIEENNKKLKSMFIDYAPLITGQSKMQSPPTGSTLSNFRNSISFR